VSETHVGRRTTIEVSLFSQEEEDFSGMIPASRKKREREGRRTGNQGEKEKGAPSRLRSEILNPKTKRAGWSGFHRSVLYCTVLYCIALVWIED
jgi:hypothetical protein